MDDKITNYKAKKVKKIEYIVIPKTASLMHGGDYLFLKKPNKGKKYEILGRWWCQTLYLSQKKALKECEKKIAADQEALTIEDRMLALEKKLKL